MQEKGPIHKAPNYSEFVFFSAGPVGDHAIEIDHANRFFESTGKSSVIIYKNNFGFLKDLAIPYLDHLKQINYQSGTGKFKLLRLFFSSFWVKRCYVLWIPIKYPLSIKLISYFVRFCTRSRFIGLDVSKKSPYGDFSEESSLYFLGKGNIIPLNSHTELFYEQGNRLLSFLGYEEVNRKPHLRHLIKDEILKKHNLLDKRYLVLHLVASSSDRSLPLRRWRLLIKDLVNQHPGVTLVFTGAKGDINFIKEATDQIAQDAFCILAGETDMQELLTVYAQAMCCITVHTGNAMLINMLHVKSVVINMVGNYMFQYHFNENSIVLFNKTRCGCGEEVIDCYVQEEGKNYMKCMYDISDEEILKSVQKQITTS